MKSRIIPIALTILLLWSCAFAASPKETILHRFTGGSDGSNPQANLISDAARNLYGTTYYGGTGTCNVNNEFLGCGTVFELSPAKSGAWTETVLYSFINSTSDGQGPVGALLFDSAGNLYGTTSGGGTGVCGFGGCGTVFELMPPAQPGGAWTETILYNFQGGGDGQDPRAGLVFDKHCALFGTTLWGGNFQGSCTNFAIGCGTVFKLTPHKSGSIWTHSVLYRFRPNNDGQQPVAPLIFDKSGNLYGTTEWGGYYSAFCGGCGTVFQLSPGNKGGWKETVLLEFDGNDGGSPLGGLIFDEQGNLYSTTSVGMTNQGTVFNGTVFRLAPPAKPSGKWKETVLHRFGTGGGPAAPYAGVIRDSAGNLYGTTAAGGKDTWGAVYRLSPPSGKSQKWTETTLHAFIGGRDGAYPEAGLLFGKSGQLYGATYDGGDTQCSPHGYDACGVIFQITY